MQANELKDLVLQALDDLKGQKIVALDVERQTGLVNYMVVATGTSNRHVKALANTVVVESKKVGVQPLGVEGEPGSEWVLVDLGDIVVHLMLAETRAFYDIERLWSEGKIIAPPVTR